MIRATRAINAPDNFMVLRDSKKSAGKDEGRKQELASVGVASETYNKNYNPNLKIIGNDKEGED